MKTLSESVDQWGLPESWLHESIGGLYHLSPFRFSSFRQSASKGRKGVDLGFHFGTEDQAMARATQLSHEGKAGTALYLYRVSLSITRPLHIKENRLGANTVNDLLMAIFQKAESEGVAGITDEMIDDWYEDRLMLDGENWKDDLSYESPEVSIGKFDRFLESIGYDSISYENRFEGSGTSYIVFDPSKVSIESVDEIALQESVDQWGMPSLEEPEQPLEEGKKISMAVFRAVKDIYPSQINHRHPGEGYYGPGTYFALSLSDAEAYATGDMSGEMKDWSIVIEYSFSGAVKTLYSGDILSIDVNYTGVDLKKKFPKESAFLLLQGEDDYNPPEGGEQLLVTKDAQIGLKPNCFWVYFDCEKTARRFAKYFQLKVYYPIGVGPFKMAQAKKIESWLENEIVSMPDPMAKEQPLEEAAGGSGLTAAFDKIYDDEKFFKEWLTQLKSVRRDWIEALFNAAGRYEQDSDDLSKSEIEEIADEAFREHFATFYQDFSSKAKLEGNDLILWRCITVEDPEAYVELLKAGRYPTPYKGVGVFWSYDQRSASCHWGKSSGKEVLLKAVAPVSSVDILQTALANMNLATGLDEREISLKPKSKVKLLAVIEDGKDILNHGPMLLLASSDAEEPTSEPDESLEEAAESPIKNKIISAAQDAVREAAPAGLWGEFDEDEIDLAWGRFQFSVPPEDSSEEEIEEFYDSGLGQIEAQLWHESVEQEKAAIRKEQEAALDKELEKERTILGDAEKRFLEIFPEGYTNLKAGGGISHYFITPADDEEIKFRISDHDPVYDHTYDFRYKRGDLESLAAAAEEMLKVAQTYKWSLDEGARGDWEKEGYELSHEIRDGKIVVQAVKDGNKVGQVVFVDKGDYIKNAPGNIVFVDEPHQRKGIATAMYQYAEKVIGKKARQGMTTGAGGKLWSQPNRPFGESLDPWGLPLTRNSDER